MNTPELQRLKMEWIAAKEAGDAQAEFNLLHDHPTEQAELIDFIAAYHATDRKDDEPLLALTQRACQTALDRVFAPQAVAATLGELRKSRSLTKVAVARGLRLTVDVWEKFESGAIELVSLSQRQLDRLAGFFDVSAEQFGTMLDNSQPSFTLNRRQTKEGAQKEQGPHKQSLSQAIARSTMSKEDKKFWSEK